LKENMTTVPRSTRLALAVTSFPSSIANRWTEISF
jgi:hypothetical protein